MSSTRAAAAYTDQQPSSERAAVEAVPKFSSEESQRGQAKKVHHEGRTAAVLRPSIENRAKTEGCEGHLLRIVRVMHNLQKIK